MSIFHCKLGGLSSPITHRLTELLGSALRTCSFVSGLLNRVGLGTAVRRNEVQRSNSYLLSRNVSFAVIFRVLQVSKRGSNYDSTHSLLKINLFLPNSCSF